MLKLDIRHFFESTNQRMVYSMFKKYTNYNKSILGILTRLVCYKGALCQGACTSPQIVNLVLSDFDMSMGVLCEDMGICYSRYCDDLTFSSTDPFDPSFLIRIVETALTPLHYKLNTKKTRFLGPGQRREVTGAVVNNAVRAARPYRQKIRQELYYIKKYGLYEHLCRIRPSWFGKSSGTAAARHYLFSLRGRIGYVAMLDPQDPFVPWALSELDAIAKSERCSPKG